MKKISSLIPFTILFIIACFFTTSNTSIRIAHADSGDVTVSTESELVSAYAALSESGGVIHVDSARPLALSNIDFYPTRAKISVETQMGFRVKTDGRVTLDNTNLTLLCAHAEMPVLIAYEGETNIINGTLYSASYVVVSAKTRALNLSQAENAVLKADCKNAGYGGDIKGVQYVDAAADISVKNVSFELSGDRPKTALAVSDSDVGYKILFDACSFDFDGYAPSEGEPDSTSLVKTDRDLGFDSDTITVLNVNCINAPPLYVSPDTDYVVSIKRTDDFIDVTPDGETQYVLTVKAGTLVSELDFGVLPDFDFVIGNSKSATTRIETSAAEYDVVDLPETLSPGVYNIEGGMPKQSMQNADIINPRNLSVRVKLVVRESAPLSNDDFSAQIQPEVDGLTRVIFSLPSVYNASSVKLQRSYDNKRFFDYAVTVDGEKYVNLLESGLFQKQAYSTEIIKVAFDRFVNDTYFRFVIEGEDCLYAGTGASVMVESTVETPAPFPEETTASPADGNFDPNAFWIAFGTILGAVALLALAAVIIEKKRKNKYF